MESEDLLQLAQDLNSLRAHRGWVALQQLVGIVHEQKVRMLIERPSPQAVVPAHAGGVIKGLEAPVKIIDKVQETARDVVAALEREAPDDDRGR